MPDLIPTPYRYCNSVENFSIQVASSKGGNYTVTHGNTPMGPYQYGLGCECMGFKYRGKCQHIETAKLEFCGWDAYIDGGEAIDGKCPKCQGETSSRMAGI